MMDQVKHPEPMDVCLHTSHGYVLVVRRHNERECVCETKTGRHLLCDELMKKLGTLPELLAALEASIT